MSGLDPSSDVLGRRRALDGFRAPAVLAVLAYHHGFEQVPGGFLGVSAFFTLSGFLITASLLGDHHRPARARIASFWRRRVRRLLPAAWVAVSFVFVLAASGRIAGPGASSSLAALANVANWQLVVADTTYAGQLTDPSPLTHFWSLAVEEQFYVVFPLVLVAVGSRLGHRWATLTTAALVVASTALMVSFGPGDRAYLGTDTRAAEILLGALAALVVLGPQRFSPGRAVRRSVAVLGVPAAAGLGWFWATAQVETEWLYRGGLLGHAALSVVVIGAALVAGPVRWLLARGPLVGLGRISYGIYLFHWPVFAWIDATPGSVPDFARRTAVTLALATASYALVERPLRLGVPLVRGRARPAFAAAAAGALVATSLSVPGPEPAEIEVVSALVDSDPTAAARAAVEQAEETDLGLAPAPTFDAGPVGPSPTSPRSAADEAPVDILVIGDSTALMVGIGLSAWSLPATEGFGRVETKEFFGCKLLRGSEVVYHHPQPVRGPHGCEQRESVWPEVIADADVDVVVLMMGPNDAGDHRWPGDAGFTHALQDDVDFRLWYEMREATELVLSAGTPVVWLTAPHIEIGRDDPTVGDRPASEDARMERFNDLLADVVDDLAEEGEPVAIVDLATYVGTLDDDRLQPDGVHFSMGSATQVARSWLGPALRVAAHQLVTGSD